MTVEGRFRERAARLHKTFSDGAAQGFDVQSLVVATGVVDADDEAGYLKCYALLTWLTGSELQGAALVLTKSSFVLVVASNDFAAFRSFAGEGRVGCPPIKVLDGGKDASTLKGALTSAVEDSEKVGTLTKEAASQRGAVADAVNSALENAKVTVNIAVGVSRILVVKDAEDISRIKKASLLSAHVYRHALLERIEKTIDQDKKVRHSVLSEIAETAILNPEKVKLKGLNANLCDPCYPPIVQSASKSSDRTFDLKPSAESDDEHLESGCIISSLGARYSNFCSNVARTLFVDATSDQKAAYKALLAAQAAAIDALVPGAKLKAALDAAVTSIKQSGVKNADEMVASLGKNVGFGTGIEYRDSAHVLNAKNETLVRDGMVFNVAVGCSKLKDSTNGGYAMLVADTVHVRGGGLKPDILTTPAKKDLSNINYEFKQEALADEDDISKDDLPDDMNGRRGRRRGGVLAGEEANEAKAEEEKRRKKQLELEQRMLSRGRALLEGHKTGPDKKEDEAKKLDEVVAYRSASSFPHTKSRQLQVDMDAEALIVPINGVPVPFHISTIKNASKSDEGRHTYLRVNFHVPQSTGLKNNFSRTAQNTPNFPELAGREGMTTAFIKELSFRSSNPQNLNDCTRRIKELVKRAQLKRTEALEKESLVTQEKVRLTKGERVPFIADASIRPALGTGKNNRGTLEAHSNGFYYRGKGGSIEIVYANVRNAFFQEADRETIVCIHFHLKNDIIVGKKKTKDVQFYVEVMESAVRLNDNRRRQFDQDELEEEQRERDMRNRTNKTFLKFTREVEERHDLDFDIPYRTLAFNGAPRSSAVTLLPTVKCIIDIIDWPPFVLNLQDVEVAHFERVNLQTRNFDLVFVFKGFQVDPHSSAKPIKDMWCRISAIEMEDLNGIKRYLNEQEIKYYEGPASLHWNNVLKNIRMDLEGFYENGGWQILSTDAGEEDEESESDGLEGDQEFEMPEDASEDEYESSDASSEYSDSEGSADMKAELEGDSDEGEDDLSSDEEGMDWDEAERKAKADDARRRDLSDDENNRRKPRGKGRSGGGGGRSNGRSSRASKSGRSGGRRSDPRDRDSRGRGQVGQKRRR